MWYLGIAWGKYCLLQLLCDQYCILLIPNVCSCRHTYGTKAQKEAIEKRVEAQVSSAGAAIVPSAASGSSAEPHAELPKLTPPGPADAPPSGAQIEALMK